MSKDAPTIPNSNGPPPEYQVAMAELEKRAARGELTIAEAKREIFALRERFAAGPAVVMQWAAKAHAEGPDGTGTSTPGVGVSGGQDSKQPDTAVSVSLPSTLPA